MSRNLLEQAIGLRRSKPHLFPKGSRPEEVGRVSDFNQNSFHAWWKHFIRGDKGFREMIESIHERQTGLVQYGLDGLEFVGWMDYADRALNGYIQILELNNRQPGEKGPFGFLLRQAREDPQLADHNREHDRRLEAWMEAFLMNVGNYRHSDTVIKWLKSLFHSGKTHDMDQLVTLERNLSEERGGTDRELSAKKGHGVAGGIMGLATHRNYAQAAGLRARDAWDVAAGSAYMSMRHDEPEALDAFLHATEPAWYFENDRVNTKVLYHGTELLRKFSQNMLDGTTVSPSQLVEILVLQKAQSGFIDRFDRRVFERNDPQEIDVYLHSYLEEARQELVGLANPQIRAPLAQSIFGLATEFEYEYAEELLQLMDDHEPILQRVLDSPQSKEALKLATQIMYKADFVDMVATPVEAIYRLLSTQYSLARDFWPREETQKALRAHINQRRSEVGEPLLDLTGDDVLLYAITEFEGNVPQETDSDVRRALWQYAHMQFVGNLQIDQSRFMHRVNQDHTIMGLLYFKEIATRIMSGDMSHVDTTFDTRIAEISRKAMRRIEINPVKSAYVMVRFRQSRRDLAQAVKKILEEQGALGDATRYSDKVVVLEGERQRLRQLISKNGRDTSPHTSEQKQRLLALCDRLLDTLCQEYGVTAKQLKRYKRRVFKNKNPQTTPFRAYDSLADPAEARTLIEM